MKTAHRALVFAAVVPAFLGSGCYTVLKGPRVASDYLEEPTYSQYGSGAGNEDLLGPRVGRTERDDPYEDFYGGAPYGGTYGGYGTPVFGYDSRTGMFGGYRYGGYYPGAGPVGYGYDPYYSGAYGTYIPPGYELVTSDELYQLRADANRGTTVPPPATTYEPPPDPGLQQQQAETQREVWQQRQETRQRPAPTLTRRPPASTTKSTATRSSSSSSSSSSSKGEEEKKTAKPKKRGR